MDLEVGERIILCMNNTVIERPLSAEEVAIRLNVLDENGEPNRRRILSYAREGAIPCVRLSQKCIRFYWSDIERALRKEVANR